MSRRRISPPLAVPVALAAAVAALAVGAARPAAAQSGASPAHPPGPPEVAAAAYMADVRRGDWDAVAGRMHPAALAELRSFLEPLLAGGGGGFLEMVFGADGAGGEPAELSDRRMFARFLAFVMDQQGVAGVMAGSRYEAIGHVMEGDTAHVVGRLVMEVEGVAMSQLDVSSFLGLDGEWRGLLTGDVSGFAAALGAMGADPR